VSATCERTNPSQRTIRHAKRDDGDVHIDPSLAFGPVDVDANDATEESAEKERGSGRFERNRRVDQDRWKRTERDTGSGSSKSVARKAEGAHATGQERKSRVQG
jgi:hypothetical protein